MPATLDSAQEALENWLIAIAQHTRETKEALQGRGGSAGALGAGTKEAKEKAFLDRLGARLEAAVGSAVAHRVGQAQALANRGFSGTVQQARYDYAMDQLGKQFAAVMMPVMNAFTYAATEVERRMRGMGGSEQNRMMGGIIGAGIGLRYGGAFGALAGAAAGSLALSDRAGPAGRYDASMGALAGAYAGARVAGPYGAVVGAGAGAMAGGGFGDYARMYGRETARDLGGNSMFSRAAAAAAAAGATIFDAGSGGTLRARLMSGGRMTAADMRPGKPDEPRRDVTPFQAQMGDAGSTYFRMQEAMIRTTAGAEFEDAGPLKPVVDLFLKAIDLLMSINGAVGGMSPMSATAARG